MVFCFLVWFWWLFFFWSTQVIAKSLNLDECHGNADELRVLDHKVSVDFNYWFCVMFLQSSYCQKCSPLKAVLQEVIAMAGII